MDRKCTISSRHYLDFAGAFWAYMAAVSVPFTVSLSRRSREALAQSLGTGSRSRTTPAFSLGEERIVVASVELNPEESQSGIERAFPLRLPARGNLWGRWKSRRLLISTCVERSCPIHLVIREEVSCDPGNIRLDFSGQNRKLAPSHRHSERLLRLVASYISELFIKFFSRCFCLSYHTGIQMKIHHDLFVRSLDRCQH
jgi:hypothetical protein